MTRFTLPEFDAIAITAPTGNAGTIDADGELAVGVYMAREAMTIDSLDLLTNTLTAAGTLDVRIETVSGSTTTGVLWSAGTVASGVNFAANTTIVNCPLSSPAVIPAGSLFAVVAIRPVGSTFNGALRASSAATASFPYRRTAPLATTATSGGISVAFKNGSTYYYHPRTSPVALLVGATNFANNVDKGNLITIDEDCMCYGIVGAFGSAVAAASWEARIYDSANNIIASRAIAANEAPATGISAGAPNSVFFATPVQLTAGQQYRYTIRNTSASNVAVYAGLQTGVTGVTQAMLRSIMRADVIGTTRTGSGAWTDSLANLCTMSLIVDENGGGGASIPQTAVAY